MDKVEAYREYMEMIEKCEISDNLSEWETNFVVNVKEQLEKKGSLSTKQVEILERIYTEKAS